MKATTIFRIRLKKGDLVMVRAGKDKGRTGKVLAVHPDLNKVTVEGINIAKRHRKPSTKYPQGGIIELTQPIWVSKVSIVEPVSKKPSRIRFDLKADGTKVRQYVTSGKEIKNAK